MEVGALASVGVGWDVASLSSEVSSAAPSKVVQELSSASDMVETLIDFAQSFNFG